jgi:hypothetical protein
MKARLFIAVVFASAILIANPLHAAIWTGEVQGLVPPDTRPCVFFSIAGVSQADPVMPGWPWIALRKSHASFKEIYAFLLAAKHSGEPVTVSTTGTAVSECDGYVELGNIYHAP